MNSSRKGFASFFVSTLGDLLGNLGVLFIDFTVGPFSNYFEIVSNTKPSPAPIQPRESQPIYSGATTTEFQQPKRSHDSFQVNAQERFLRKVNKLKSLDPNRWSSGLKQLPIFDAVKLVNRFPNSIQKELLERADLSSIAMAAKIHARTSEAHTIDERDLKLLDTFISKTHLRISQHQT